LASIETTNNRPANIKTNTAMLRLIGLVILMGNPEGKRPLERPRCWWVDNIKMDLREIGWGGMDWIDLAQDRNQ
jgi:hypothetical protein